MKPLLLLDVDGVIRILGPEPAAGVLDTGSDLLISAQTPHLLKRLAARFDLVWATSWHEEANEVVSPILALPPLPVVRFDLDTPVGTTYKLPPIQAFVRARAFAWVDDDIGNDVHDWVRKRREPSLLLPVDPRTGLTSDHLDALLEFANRIDQMG